MQFSQIIHIIEANFPQLLRVFLFKIKRIVTGQAKTYQLTYHIFLHEIEKMEEKLAVQTTEQTSTVK
jgi:hypothetical protein